MSSPAQGPSGQGPSRQGPPGQGPPRDEVLADTRETLRAVARTLDTLGTPPAQDEEGVESLPALQRLARFLAESYGELAEILEGLSKTRSLFRQAEVDSLQRTHMALQEVTEQTELVTTDMLDGLERSLGLVDRLEGPPGSNGSRTKLCGDLREELHQVMQHLQFQDITAQQIGHATMVLADVEHRLLALIGTLERHGFTGAEAGDPVQEGSETCDPGATLQGAESRQALADDIFA